MTEVINSEPRIGAGSLAEALNDVSRSAQQLLADVNSQPRALRIRAGDVQVELEWPAHVGSAPAGVVPQNVATAEELTAGETATASGLFDLCAPTVGTFYVSPEPGAAPFVAEGDLVRAGQQVGIVEAMKLMIPIEAERDGQVIAVLAANGGPVEYGDRLFTFATACSE
ncbi:acetyl-CoA carboxylase, biotin carboxyl carrier protein [Rhizocola hellebori]|uniref:Biotin carboxyl carrier protein of acetyl-CoA carboxylase n=1 Tax=Rhizocola hellebori TaxID=1392758 RepID=A0A8J3QH19_9ACTN|nr:acetyl-CoA carboxylase biotin carboxyl carrier protein subunit [Rhizocola hellebori]GIH09575.1 acetyl-CoA carboxylase, biotin carboxyl carrier protein [Rhizocola hellebori]